VRHAARGVGQAGQGVGAPATLWDWLSAGQPYFDCAFLQKFELCDKNARYRSCRGDIPLQYLQRPTYILVNGLFGNTSRKSAFARPKTLFTWLLTEFLSFQTSKFGMPPMEKVVFLEMTNNFQIG
jgi:hypothetical protein